MHQPELMIGESASLRMRKWDGSAHRQATTMYLGADEYGRWLGYQPDTDALRPSVRLIPHNE